MRFISLSSLKKICASYGDPEVATEREKIKNALSSEEGLLEASGYSRTEILEMLTLVDDQSRVFLQWIEQDKELLAILEGRAPKQVFQDHFHWIGHALAAPFAQFLTPFLSSAALKFREESNTKTLLCLFSYLKLLPPDDQLVVEQELFKGIKIRLLQSLSFKQNAQTEEELLSITETVCSSEIVGIIGELSRSSYHSKVWYVDEMLTFFKHPACTARLAYRIIQRLNELELNPEHQNAIKEIETNLKTGQILVQKQNKKKNFRPTIRQIVSIVLFSGLIFTIYYIFTYQEKTINNPDLNLASSFEQFSKEERKQIDSLLRSQRQDQATEENAMDQYLWTQGSGVSLTLKKPLENKRMEELYNDWLLDARLFEKGLIDSCKNVEKTNSFQFKGVKSTDELKGDQMTAVRNESEYSVYVFVFDEQTNGGIYSKLLKKDQTVSLNLKTGQFILFIAGNNLTKFTKPSGLGSDELPSAQFDHHFCDVDFNLSLSLNTLYIFKFPHKGSNKLMLSGDQFSSFEVADLYGILETF